jgi:hypothetical protein
MAEELMDPYEFGRASAFLSISLFQQRHYGRPCEDGHLFFDFCECEDCDENWENGYLPTPICTLCGDCFDLYEDEDEDEV